MDAQPEIEPLTTPGALPRARTDAEHAARLLDVLSLVDAIPHRRRAQASAVPRMVSTRPDLDLPGQGAGRP